MIQTVTGPVPADKIKGCLIHEHVSVGFPGLWMEFPPNRAAFVEQAVSEMEKLKSEGISTLIDATPADLVRDPELLRDVAQRSGMQIVCAAGYYTEAEGSSIFFKSRMGSGKAQNEVYRMLRQEIRDGIGDTGIKAGIIKVSTGAHKITDYENMFLDAAAKVSIEEDVCIITHTDQGTMGAEQARRLIAAGANPNRIMIGHLSSFENYDELKEIFTQGVYGGFDRWGHDFVLPTEPLQFQFVKNLVELGYANKILFSTDYGLRVLGDDGDRGDLPPKNTWHYIFEKVFPTLSEMGISSDVLDSFLNSNALSFLG